MPTNLPTDLLRSFAAIVDTGSMVHASKRVFVTQAALSQQMKRLAEITKVPIFYRHNQGLLLTPAGKSLLGFARAMLELNDRAILSLAGEVLIGPARIGMVQDFADILLSEILVNFAQAHSELQMQVRVGSSSEITALLSAGLLDISLCLGSPGDPNAIKTEKMVWLGHARLWDQEPLPIAVMDEPCLFRAAALTSLTEAGYPYRIALETASTSVLKAAVEGGLGVTCRTNTLFGVNLPPLEKAELPLPDVAYTLTTGNTSHRTIEHLSHLLGEAISRV